MDSNRGAAPYPVAILLLEKFSLISFAMTVEPLREANGVAGRRAYDWIILSHDGKPVKASNGLSIDVDGSISDRRFYPMVIVCSSFDPHLYVNARIRSWLRRLDRLGAEIGGVETGAFVLANAGLLDGHRATIHWENIQSIAEAYPNVNLTAGIFEIDRRRFTASGAAAAMDMMLYFISLRLGKDVAHAVAEEFIYNRMRSPETQQRLDVGARLNTRHPRLNMLLRQIDTMLDERLDVVQMAEMARLSEREVRRIFSACLGVSPQCYHRSRRLEKARSLLRQTDMSVSEVALTCGFASSSDFSRAFKREFGRRPVDERSEVHLPDLPLIRYRGL